MLDGMVEAVVYDMPIGIVAVCQVCPFYRWKDFYHAMNQISYSYTEVTLVSMDGTAPEIVNLDSLNAKQKAKEYKLTAKDIKSKEVAKRSLALEKVSDERYFLEGGCLVPLIDSTAPKKV